MTSVVLVWPNARQEAGELPVPDGRLVVADWDPASEDGGRRALLTSVRDARELSASLGEDPDALVIVGFGSGAVAAAGLTRYARRLSIGLGRVLCVAPTWDEPDPFSGIPLGEVPEGVELVPDAASAAALLTA
ncbi:MAG: hypothetical protein ACJ71Z_01845 [Aeromicrobium sp.]